MRRRVTMVLTLALPLAAYSLVAAAAAGEAEGDQGGASAAAASASAAAAQRRPRRRVARPRRRPSRPRWSRVDMNAEAAGPGDERRDVRGAPARSRAARRRAQGPDPAQPHAPRAPQRHDRRRRRRRLARRGRVRRTRCRAPSSSRARSSSSTGRSSTTARTTRGALADQKDIPIFSGSMPPGDHTIQVALTFQGNGYGVFSYLRGYKFEVKSSHSFTAVEGKTLTVTATAFEKGGVTTPLEQRPDDRVAREGPCRSSAPPPAAAPPQPGRLRGRGVRLREPVDRGRQEVKGSRACCARTRVRWRSGACGRVAARGDARASADDAVAAAQTDLASVGSGLDRVQAAVAAGQGRAADRRAAARERRAPLPDEGLRPRDRRPQRDPRRVPEHAELPRRALASRRDVLRAARLPRGAPRLPRARRSRQRAALPDLLRQGARAPRRRVAAPERPAGVARARSSRSSTRCPRRRSTRRSSTRRARRYYRQGLVERRDGRVLAGRQRHRLRAPGALLPGPRRDEGRARAGAGSDAGAARRRRASNYKPAIEAFQRRHRAAARHARAPARHRSRVDGDRPPLLRDGAVPAGERGLLEGRPRQPRVRHDALRARVGVRAARRRPARRARARGARRSPIPNSEYIGDGTLLRADLLLRAGAFDRALQLYEGVRTQYEPMRAKVDVVPRLDEGRERLLRQARAAAARPARPERPAPAARRPLGARGRGRAARVRGHRRRQRVQDAHPAVERSSSTSSRRSCASNRVRAFPELAAGEEAALGLINRVSRARLDARARRSTTRSRPICRRRDRGGPPAAARADGGHRGPPGRRRATSPSASSRASRSGTRSRRSSPRATSEVDTLQATVNGLRRMLSDGRSRASRAIPASVQRFQAELDANEHDLKLYRDEMAELRRQIEMGRAQIGLGDARYQNDAAARDSSATRSSARCSSPRAGPRAAARRRYAGQARPLLAQARAVRGRPRRLARISSRRRSRSGRARCSRRSTPSGPTSRRTSSSSTATTARRATSSATSPQRNFALVRDKLRGHRPARRRRHHRAGVGGARGGARPRAQPAGRARAAGAAPRRGAERSQRRRRRAWAAEQVTGAPDEG